MALGGFPNFPFRESLSRLPGPFSLYKSGSRGDAGAGVNQAGNQTKDQSGSLSWAGVCRDDQTDRSYAWVQEEDHVGRPTP